MTDLEIINEMTELAKKIEYHNYLYYVVSKPEVSDIEFDKMFEKLKSLELKYPDLADPNSPTKKVGSDIDNQFPEYVHTIPVLSLDKIYSEKEILEWITKITNKAKKELNFTIEPKIDGFSVVLYYINGKLDKAVSRGNGEVGNDITENIKTIKSIPLLLKESLNLAVRGEVFIEKKDFADYNKKMENIYANPRNFASGSIRRIKSSEVAQIPLKIYVYDALFMNKDINNNLDSIQTLRNNFFPVNPGTVFFSSINNNRSYIGIEEKTISKIGEYLESMKKNRLNLGYEIDGLVIKVNEYSIREELGYTAHHPRWALAYKFEFPQNVSKVVGIDIQIGRTGRVTPLARIEPVKISGSTVSRATLHNQDYINQLELGIGDTVVVSKRGEIIPAIEEVIEKGENPTFLLPKDCPECKTLLEVKGAHLFCVNKHCPARIRESIIYFVQTIDIENLGKETVKLLIDQGFIKNITDIFVFDYNQLNSIDGFGSKKISLIQKGIEKCKTRPFEIVLESLGLTEIGPKVIEILIDNNLDSMEKIITAASKNDKTLFLSMHGIGESTAQSIIKHFNDSEVLQILEFFKKNGFSMQSLKKSEIKKEGIFSGTIWCITGVFERFKPRDKALDIIKQHGGDITDSVTKKTTCLLAGTDAGSKLDKAKKLGVKIVSELELLKLLEDGERKNKENSLF